MDKKNFEKDINVPSKRRIMDDYNAKDCEQCSPDSVCCYCKNIAYYNLEEQLKNEKHSHEHTKVWIGEYIKKHPYRKDEYEQLKAENEELKKQNNQFDNGINEQFSKIVELEGRNNLLKVILTEIKEIAEKQCVCGVNCIDMKQILQKISEVVDEA